MAKKTLTAQDIADLDEGRVRVAIAHALKQIALDLADRPHEKVARKLRIDLQFKPVLSSEGALESADARVAIVPTFPKKQTRSLSMGVHHSGALVHNAASPTDIRQGTLDEGI